MTNAFKHLVNHFGNERSCNERLSKADRRICLHKLPENRRTIRQAITQWNKVGRGLTKLCNLQNGPQELEGMFDYRSGTLQMNGDMSEIHRLEK
jgi:hypothetical protein